MDTVVPGDLFADRLPVVSLDTVRQRVPLGSRYENRFVIPIAAIPDLVGDLAGSHHVVAVDGSVLNRVRNVYSDTADLYSYRAHFRTNRRWKVRMRSYPDSHRSRAEVKIRDARGRTHKHYGQFTQNVSTEGLIDHALGVLAPGFERTVRALEPAITTSYGRVTIVDLGVGERITVDTDLVLAGRDGKPVGALRDGLALLETKSSPPRSVLSARLRLLGARALGVTKYTAAVALAGYHRPVPGAATDLGRYYRSLSAGPM